MREDKYEFEVGEQGQIGLDILDRMFNPNTQKHILEAGIKSGFRVLDIGCGRGAMSLWLANQVGPTGKVLAIDNNENQIQATEKLTQGIKPEWLTFKLYSAYDIDQLNETFDMVYCRFILHHVNNPTSIIEKVFKLLPPGGIFVAEEGIVSAAFTYPPIQAWGKERLQTPLALEKEGENRDGNFGMKLFYQMANTGFHIKEASLFQPLLHTKQQKAIMGGQTLEEFKVHALNQGMSQSDWEKHAAQMNALIADDHRCLGFYQSCLVVGQK